LSFSTEFYRVAKKMREHIWWNITSARRSFAKIQPIQRPSNLHLPPFLPPYMPQPPSFAKGKTASFTQDLLINTVKYLQIATPLQTRLTETVFILLLTVKEGA
jgi:hypothetical protein